MIEPTERSYNPFVCESCGDEFGCGAKLDGCWCMEVTLSEKSTAEIAKDFAGCLCPQCLGSFAARPAMKRTCENGLTKVILDAVRIDTTNNHGA